MTKNKTLKITAYANGWGERASNERQEIFDSVENFLKLLKVIFVSDYIDYQTKIFTFNIDDYEYMLILQCLRLSELHYEFD